MGYCSGSYTKSQYAGTLAATLAYFLYTQGDAVGLATFDDQIRQYMFPRNRPGYLRRLMVALEAAPEGSSTRLEPPLQHIGELLTKKGLIILISDFLTSIGRLEPELGYLCTGGHDLVVFHILDPAELKFDFDSPALFQDMETGRNMYVDPSDAKMSYKRMLEKHLAMTESICSNLGIDYHLFATDRPFDLALLDFLHDRMRHRKRIRHGSRPKTRRTI